MVNHHRWTIAGDLPSKSWEGFWISLIVQKEMPPGPLHTSLTWVIGCAGCAHRCCRHVSYPPCRSTRVSRHPQLRARHRWQSPCGFPLPCDSRLQWPGKDWLNSTGFSGSCEAKQESVGFKICKAKQDIRTWEEEREGRSRRRRMRTRRRGESSLHNSSHFYKPLTWHVRKWTWVQTYIMQICMHTWVLNQSSWKQRFHRTS